MTFKPKNPDEMTARDMRQIKSRETNLLSKLRAQQIIPKRIARFRFSAGFTNCPNCPGTIQYAMDTESGLSATCSTRNCIDGSWSMRLLK